MFKKAVVLGLTLSFLGIIAVKASEYDDCLKDLSGIDKKILGNYEYSICLKQEAARLLKEVQKEYTKLSVDKHYQAWNSGNEMFKGRLRDTYNAWLVYRNDYCDLLGFASKHDKGSEDFYRETCRVKLTADQLEAIKSVKDAELTEID